MKNSLLSLFLLAAVLVTGCSQRMAVHVLQASPQMQAWVSSSQVRQGHALRIRAANTLPGARIRLEGIGRSIDLIPRPDSPVHHEGLLAVPLDAVIGPEELVLTAWVDGQPAQTVKTRIEIVSRGPYKTSWLKIKDFRLARYEEESKLFAEARKNSSGFKGLPIMDFEWPVTGRITEQFGVKRIYNEGISPWYHSGLDSAAPGGTTITAPADGVVILAGDFKAHGGTVLVDHGYGVITAYLHQRAIHVKPGDLLRRGDPIGEVGSTGGSTGNHLHFQVNIHGQIVSPWDFLSEPAQASTQAVK